MKQKQTVFPQSPQQPYDLCGWLQGYGSICRKGENPAAVREIKDILLSNVSKSHKICVFYVNMR